jgi:hypothetical protein
MLMRPEMKLKLASAVMMFVLMIGMNAHALTIDSFSGAQNLGVGTHLGLAEASGTAEGTGIVGGLRDASLSLMSGWGASLDIGSQIGSVLNFSNDAGSTSNLMLRYDGGGKGPGGIDLTEGGFQDAFDLSILFDDIPVNIGITVESLGGVSSLTQMAMGGIFAIPSHPSQNMIFEFSDFAATNGSGADFSSVTAVQLDVTTFIGGTDLSFDYLGTTGINTPPLAERSAEQPLLFTTEADEIPEPTTLLLLGGGLMGLAGYRLRRQRRTA